LGHILPNYRIFNSLRTYFEIIFEKLSYVPVSCGTNIPLMEKNGPIVIIEDDADDQQLLIDIFSDLGIASQLKIFPSGELALDYLRKPETKPFLVISDINMPRMSGFQLRDLLLQDTHLSEKCIPFIFCTTGATGDVVRNAYRQSVQGIFKKPVQYGQWKSMLQAIITYWSEGISPNRI
jgi:CheY-like chemotaxis protein